MHSQGIFNHLPANNSTPQLALWASQILLITLTIQLFYPALAWMFDAFTAQEHRFQLIGVLMLLGFLIHKQVINRHGINRELPLQLRTTTISLYIVSVAGFVVNEYLLAIHIISATFCVLALYAVFGFFVPKNLWRKGLIPTILLIILLPFGDYLNVYLGFPLRLFSAYVAADTLTALGYPSMSSETIIVLENQYANVDLNCSGIKGIWSGLAFFVLLSWIENKAIGFGWLWRFSFFIMALVAANILRISILVLLGSHFSYFEFADLIHELLGIIGFTLACLIGWGLLLTQKTQTESCQQKVPLNETVKKPSSALMFLLFTIVALNVLYTPMPKTNELTVNTLLELPEHWSPTLVNLSFQESEFFNRNQAQAHKYRFQLDNNTNASLIAVHSTYWKDQHDPKNCLISQGYNISNDTTLRLATTQSVRYLDLIKDGNKYVAIYWFQNANHMTDDYSKRIFTSIFNKHNPWVLASMLIENPGHDEFNIRDVISPIQLTIHKILLQATSNEHKN